MPKGDSLAILVLINLVKLPCSSDRYLANITNLVMPSEFCQMTASIAFYLYSPPAPCPTLALFLISVVKHLSYKIFDTMFSTLFPISVVCALFYATRAASSPNAKLENAVATQKYRTTYTALLMLFVSAHQWMVPALGLFYLFLSIALKNHDNPTIRNTSELICPNIYNVNVKAFDWSWSTGLALAAMAFGGVLRKEAYAQLESNFTFALQKPLKLKTGGLYKYMQHPSYTGALICLWGTGRLLLRGDGLIRCWTDYTYTQWAVWESWGVWVFPWMHLLVWCTLFARRIHREEKMLKAECGDEWLRWHVKTKRLVPGLW